MRAVLIYLLALFSAAVVVFFLTYTVGRGPSLEQELSRRSAAPRGEPAALTIPSLKSPEEEEGEEIAEPAEPVVRKLKGGVTLTRFPQEAAGMVILLDGELLEGGGTSLPAGDFRRGLESFFRRLPANVQVGLRSLAGALEGDCGGTARMAPLGFWKHDELTRAYGNAVARGPRSLARSIEEAAADLDETPGERALVVVTAGDEECGGAPCQTAAELRRLLPEARIFTVMLRPPAPPDALGPEPPPVWQSRLQCMADKGGGEFFRASSGAELEEALLRAASSLQPNLTVRAMHSTEREVTGVNVENRDAWGLTVSPAAGGEALRTDRLPGTFSLPSGNYTLKVRYMGRERSLKSFRIPPRERVEVQVNFRAAELYVQAKDSAGNDLVGDTDDFDCFWGAVAFQGTEAKSGTGSSCSFPAYFVLDPGTYSVRVWKGDENLWVEEVLLKEGEATEKTVVFEAEEQLLPASGEAAGETVPAPAPIP